MVVATASTMFESQYLATSLNGQQLIMPNEGATREAAGILRRALAHARALARETSAGELETSDGMITLRATLTQIGLLALHRYVQPVRPCLQIARVEDDIDFKREISRGRPAYVPPPVTSSRK